MSEAVPKLPSPRALERLEAPGLAGRRAALRHRDRGLCLALGLRFLWIASLLHGEASYMFFVPAILIASALGGWGPGSSGDASLASCSAYSSSPNFAVAYRGGRRQCLRLRRGRRRRFMAWRAAAPVALVGRGKCGSRGSARGASAIDPRHRPGCHDRHRRTRHHSILQRGGGAAVRLSGAAR